MFFQASVKDKLTTFKGDLLRTCVADPCLEAMALKPPLGLRSRCVRSPTFDPGRSKLPNLVRIKLPTPNSQIWAGEAAVPAMAEHEGVYAMLTSPDMGLRMRREGKTAIIMFISSSSYIGPMDLASWTLSCILPYLPAHSISPAFRSCPGTIPERELVWARKSMSPRPIPPPL